MHLAPGLGIGFVRKGRVTPIHLACVEGMIVDIRSPVSLGRQIQAVFPKARIGVPALFGDQADHACLSVAVLGLHPTSDHLHFLQGAFVDAHPGGSNKSVVVDEPNPVNLHKGIV